MLTRAQLRLDLKSTNTLYARETNRSLTFPVVDILRAVKRVEGIHFYPAISRISSCYGSLGCRIRWRAMAPSSSISIRTAIGRRISTSAAVALVMIVNAVSNRRPSLFATGMRAKTGKTNLHVGSIILGQELHRSLYIK